MDTRYPDIFVVSTAPSRAQISAIVWREIRLLKGKIDQRHRDRLIDHTLPGYITADNEWKTDDGQIFAFGRRPPEKSEGDMVQGIHSRHVLAVGDEACHDAETDVLTGRGWVAWPEVTEDDTFLTKCAETGRLEYQAPSRLVAYPYEGDMYHYSNRTSDFMVTPNHTMWYETSVRRGVTRKDEIRDMVFSNKFMSRLIDGYKGAKPDDTYVIPAVSFKIREYHSDRPEMRFRVEDWAEFLAWFISEGSIAKTEHVVRLTQGQQKYRDEIESLLGRMGLGYSTHSTDYAIFSTQLARHLLEVCKGRTQAERTIPSYVRTWDKGLMDLFLDTYVKGDGYSRGATRDILYTSNVVLADALQEICLLAGYSSTVAVRPVTTGQPMKCGRRITSTRPGYAVTRSQRNGEVRLRKESLEKVPYSGMVYCATVPNGSLFTRRNGKTLWSGNCGLTGNMINALQNITSNKYSRRFLIANPTEPNSAFGEIFLDERLATSGVWATNSISVLESPNFTEERYELPPEVLAELTGTDYAEDMEREYGRDSAQYISRVLGEFARDTDAPYLFKEADINEATDTEIIPRTDDQVVLGVDVARFGKDRSVIYKAQAGRVRFVASEGGETRVTEVANWVHRHAIDLNASEVRVDGLGIGGGVVDTLLSFTDRKYRLVSMNSSGATPDSRRWHNARAHWADTFRSNMRAGLIDLSIEDEMFDVLKNELLDIQYKYNASTGGIVLESKDDIRKRGGRSPDFLDAAMFAAMGAENYAPKETPRKQYLYEDAELHLDPERDNSYYLSLM